MNNTAPIREPAGPIWSQSWASWFQQVFDCLSWKKSFNYAFPLDFPSIGSQSQVAMSAIVPGIRVGSFVQVTPSNDVSGVMFSGVVTADNTVTIYAKNFTSGAIDPAPLSFRVLILQN